MDMIVDKASPHEQTENAEAELKEYEKIVVDKIGLTGNVTINDFVLL